MCEKYTSLPSKRLRMILKGSLYMLACVEQTSERSNNRADLWSLQAHAERKVAAGTCSVVGAAV
jgi:hypothetical protein